MNAASSAEGSNAKWSGDVSSKPDLSAMKSRSSADGKSAQENISKMIDAVRALECAADDAHTRADSQGAHAKGSEGIRKTEDNVISVLGLCSRAAKLGAGHLALTYAQRAFETLGPSPNSPSVFVYSAMLDVCAKAGEEQQASLVMKMMNADGVEPNVVTYSTFVSMYATLAERGDRRAPYKAMRALDEMRSLGLVPNEFSYSSAIAACAGATNSIGCSKAVELGRMLLAAMKRDGLQVTAVPYNTLLAGCARAVATDPAAMPLSWQLFREVQAEGIQMTAVTYTTLIDAGARALDQRILDEGLQLLQRMTDEGIEPSVMTFNAMFKAYASAAKAYASAAARSRSPKRERERDRERQRGNQQGKQRAKQMLDSAMALLEEMRRMGLQPDVYSFNTLLSACACAAAEGRKAPKRGLRALELMQQANVPPSAQSFTQLLHACSLAEEAGAKNSIEIGLRVRALMWAMPRDQSGGASFVDTFVTPREAPHADGNVLAEQVVVDAGATSSIRPHTLVA
jgi:pentatricopeptide repeat protein